MESVFIAGLRALIELDAVPWAIVVLLAVVLVWVTRFFQKEIKTIEAARAKDTEAWDKKREELYNRIIELGDMTRSALMANTTSTSALSVSVEARAAAFVKTSELLQAILDKQEANRQYFGGWTERIERKMEAIDRATLIWRDHDRIHPKGDR